MKKRVRPKLVTIKVDQETVNNLNMAAAIAKKYQYEVANEGSLLVLSNYVSPTKKKIKQQ